MKGKAKAFFSDESLITCEFLNTIVRAQRWRGDLSREKIKILNHSDLNGFKLGLDPLATSFNIFT